MENEERIETQSVADSMVSTMSKHGKHLAKHCTGCVGNKLIAKWAQHIERSHFGDKNVKWVEYVQSQTSSRTNNRNKLVRCSKCEKDKRSDLFDKESAICKACLAPPKVKASKPWAQNINKKRSYLQSSCPVPLQKSSLEEDSETISSHLDQISINDADVEEEKDFKMPLSTKRLNVQELAIFNKEPQPNKLASFVPYSIPVTQTAPIVIEQGKRDRDALNILKEIELKGESDQTKQAKVISILHFFTQPIFITHLSSQPKVLTNIIQQLLCLSNAFREEQFVGIALAAVLLGTQTWSHLTKFVDAIQDKPLQREVLNGLQVYLCNYFADPSIAKWTIKNWQYLTTQTLELALDLKKNPTVDACLMLDCSLCVNSSDDIGGFRLFCETFIPSKNMFDLFHKAVILQPQQLKLHLIQFADLSFELRKNQNIQILQQHESELLTEPLVKWMDLIQQWQSKSLIQDVDSVQQQLNLLQEKYGMLPSVFRGKTINSAVPVFATVHHKLFPRPNNIQVAMAWYCSTMVFQKPLQLIVVRAGQGKSFIEKLSAFFLLQTQSTGCVHFVYINSHLLLRDKEAFQQLQLLGCLTDIQVCFQLGLAFKRDPKDIIIIDEADEIVFSDPGSFKQMVNTNHCICFTATSDDCDANGTERNIISLLGFNVISPVGIASTIGQPPIDRVLSLKSVDKHSELHQFIKDQLKIRAILLYCTEQMRFFLEQQKQPYLFIDAGVSAASIANMDALQQDGSYLLVITTNPKIGMRGLDYRAPINGITLILHESFENQREATQGLFRVGRYKDFCERILVEGTPLICPKKEAQYFGRLGTFIASQHNKVLAAVHIKQTKQSQKNAGQTSIIMSQNKTTKFVQQQLTMKKKN